MKHERQHMKDWWMSVKFKSANGVYDRAYEITLYIASLAVSTLVLYLVVKV